MYITAVATPRNEAERKLLSEQHKLRAEVFSGRLGWEVNVHGGYERDHFDGLRPTYILAVADNDRVTGCAPPSGNRPYNDCQRLPVSSS